MMTRTILIFAAAAAFALSPWPSRAEGNAPQAQTPSRQDAAQPAVSQTGGEQQQQQGGTGSAVRTTGLPVPRYASLKSDQVNMRSGPGVRYPIQWVYARKTLPVEITAEYDTWRRIRDSEGTEGWVHQSMLSAHRTGVVTGKQIRDIKAAPAQDAEIVARAEPGVIGDLLQCGDGWCQLKFGDVKGWLPLSAFWGAKPDDKVN